MRRAQGPSPNKDATRGCGGRGRSTEGAFGQAGTGDDDDEAVVRSFVRSALARAAVSILKSSGVVSVVSVSKPGGICSACTVDPVAAGPAPDAPASATVQQSASACRYAVSGRSTKLSGWCMNCGAWMRRGSKCSE